MNRTFTHAAPGPVSLSLDIEVAHVTVYVERIATATMTVEPQFPGDSTAAELIEGTTADSNGDRFAVRVPRPAGSRGAVTMVQSRGNVHVAGRGITIVNGVIISGGATVVDGGELRVVVHLPFGSSLDATGSSLDVNVHGDLTRAEVETISGDVRLSHAVAARVATTSGDVWLGHTESAELRSVSGDVTVCDLAGRARVKTVSGNVAVHAVATSTVRAASVSGDLDITAEPGIEVDADTRTVSGRTRNRHGR